MKVSNEIFFATVEEQLAEGQRVRIELKGVSMLPTLRPGEMLTLAPIEGEPKVGEVVLFRCGGQHLLHRVVAVDAEGCTLQGDNCYGVERCRREDVVARLVVAGAVATDSLEWARRSRRSLRRKRAKNFIIRWLGRNGRRQLRPWYFVALAFLMWAPLNGLGIPLDNYILGLRADHLLHASVFLPCALFLWDLFEGNRRRWAVWLTAVAVGLLTEGVQWLLPYRGYDVNDLVANFLGASLGWIVVLTAMRRRRANR